MQRSCIERGWPVAIAKVGLAFPRWLSYSSLCHRKPHPSVQSEECYGPEQCRNIQGGVFCCSPIYTVYKYRLYVTSSLHCNNDIVNVVIFPHLMNAEKMKDRTEIFGMSISICYTLIGSIDGPLSKWLSKLIQYTLVLKRTPRLFIFRIIFFLPFTFAHT